MTDLSPDAVKRRWKPDADGRVHLTGAEQIAAERKRQIEEEGWTAGHDAAHDNGELWRAAICYASGRSDGWPWAPRWYKPGPDRVRSLVKAGALIAAEIDRLTEPKEDPE